ncbi:hypothetical protein [Agitococcus lubricus]|uniref:Tfp pilus assembly protein PilN n=1 Tax=Agitococcus lubricus TaxID=1077255 RepID=A0A2T5J229_9GAMM|nr:hypothetical protein [Agitococcus lubricus]PTQ90500.1 hypothetical protein C8N29_103255 [Agitococcus lubricus]
MAKLHINFAKSTPHNTTLRLVNLAVGGALLLLCVWQVMERDRLITQMSDIDTQQSRLERQLRLQQGFVKAPVSDVKAEQEVNNIATQLTFPWLTILSSLHELRGNDIHLSKIEPKAGSNEVLIQGYAPQQQALFAFISRIENHTDWQAVLPQRQEQTTTLPDKPLYFQLSAQWRGQP